MIFILICTLFCPSYFRAVESREQLRISSERFIGNIYLLEHTCHPQSLQIQSPISYGVHHITFGTNNSEWGASLIQCKAGGFAISGSRKSPGSFYVVLLIRTDDIGSRVWKQEFSGPGWDLYGIDLTELDNGGFMLFSQGFTTMSAPQIASMLLMCTTSEGNELWTQTYDPPYTFEPFLFNRAGAFSSCENGDFILVEIIDPDYHSWVVRTDNNGTPLWHHDYYEWKYCTEIIECKSGGFALIGENGWLLRLDQNGNQLWNQTYSAYSYLSSLTECRDGGFALIGSTKNIYYDDNDVLLLRTNATGHQLWNITYGGVGEDWGLDLVETAEEHFAITGYSNSTPNGDYDLLFLQTNANGTIIREFTYGGIDYDYGSSLIDLGNNEFAITGSTKSFGNGGSDVWLVRVLNPESIPPTWIDLPTDQAYPYGKNFTYCLNASDPSGLNTWWTSDPIRLPIDNKGVISPGYILPPNQYPLQIWVNDTFNNILTANFTITITPPLFPLFPLTITFFLILPILLIISVVVYNYHYKKKRYILL